VTSQRTPTTYEIKVRGRLDMHWSEWLENMDIAYDDSGNSIISGPLVDQSTLYGLLKKIHDLGLTLVSVNPVRPQAKDHGEIG
jgi:hypothetical protein